MRLHLFAKVWLVFLLCVSAVPALAAPDNAKDSRRSYNWSGYSSNGKNLTGVGATWVVPTAAASTTLMADAAWVGVGGVKKSDLIQAGTQAVVRGGKVAYSAWYELLPDYQKPVPLSVSPGDKIKVDIVELAEDIWQISFTNITTGQTHMQVVQYHSRRSSAEWIEEMPAVSTKGERIYAPLSEFGSIAFEGAYVLVNGQRKDISDIHSRAVSMVSRTGRIVLAQPSVLVDDGFTITRENVIPSPSPKKNAKPGDIVWSRGK